RLIDCNIEDLLDGDLEWADLVMVGSMLPQQLDAQRIIARAHASGKPVVVGGPDVTASPDVYADADFRVLGEAEELMGEFVAAWHAGEARGTFVAESFPDLTRSPVPRFDLLKLEHYMHVGVQFSRGCPYNCEFCNVIELNGRVPRFKKTDQMLKELDCLHELGHRGHVDFVDDNLIGNPKATRAFLAALGDWRKRRSYRFEFTSEASLNLADDDGLLALMRRAGFFAIFVGIESPDTDILLSTHKAQNTGRDIAASIRKIHRAGMFVNAGFIVGFDGETASVSQAMIACIEEAAIPVCMVGLLYALPNTQLARRLCAEGRLHASFDRPASDDATDQCTSGLNYVTLRPRGEILTDYRTILRTIYHPRAFFGRVRRMARDLDLARPELRRPLRVVGQNLRSFLRISLQMGVRDQQARGHYWRALGDCLLHNPRALRTVVSFAALYLHVRPFAQFLERRLSGQIEALDTGDSLVRVVGEVAGVVPVAAVAPAAAVCAAEPLSGERLAVDV
ncbi:MAG: B12-binding domain-containing radical SAM protein, partial [Candidatus Eisenbacteria sp.]|nr:B12-binding domain-containing radical SAM protein [Candidatus Eisenbacteria bacterium]